MRRIRHRSSRRSSGCAHPKGAPNVLIVLIDDVGFGATSAFGGPCQTPTAEKLAAGGLKFTRFHTTALCSPTRQALLTGRNHHSVGMGGITEIATGAPGYCSVLPNSHVAAREDAEAQRLLHRAVRQVPRGAGLGDEPGRSVRRLADGRRRLRVLLRIHRRRGQPVVPDALRGTTPIEPEKTPEEGYHLMEDMTDKAIAWIGQQKSLLPDKPFFIYFAPGATHAPHHVPKEWADKYKGKFDQGWDKLREETFARQKKLGVIPQDCQLTRAPQGDPRLGRDARRVQAGAAPRDGGVRRLHGVHRPPCGPVARLTEGSWASPTTRSSTTSSATTAPPRRARSTAASTR